MSGPKHTAEPWAATQDAHIFSEHVGNEYGYQIARLNHDLTDFPAEEIQANAARIVACVNACKGMADPAAEIEILRSHSCLRTICEALGWQGGTIHQAVEEITRLRTENEHWKARIGLGYDDQRALERLRDELAAALQQCYDHLGWNPAKVPAHVAECARAALAKVQA